MHKNRRNLIKNSHSFPFPSIDIPLIFVIIDSSKAPNKDNKIKDKGREVLSWEEFCEKVVFALNDFMGEGPATEEDLQAMRKETLATCNRAGNEFGYRFMELLFDEIQKKLHRNADT